MAHSLSKVIVHIVFSTRKRKPLIVNNREGLHAYIATLIRNLGGYVFRVGGVDDHVHIACSLPRTITQSDFLRHIKSYSSKWMKEQGNKDFFWQNGYGIFSVSESHLLRLIKYIDNQIEHHRKNKYEAEYRKLLDKYQVKFEEKYLWD